MGSVYFLRAMLDRYFVYLLLSFIYSQSHDITLQVNFKAFNSFTRESYSMRHSTTFLIIVLSIFLSCTTREQEALSRVVSHPDVQYGQLAVPENRKDPKSRFIEITYAVLEAVDRSSNELPIIFLQGGPGGPSLPMISFWLQSPLRQSHDIILFDQRGTGKSEAYCSTVGAQFLEVLARDMTVEEEYQAILQISETCKKELVDKKVDRAGYNTRENVADLEALRQHLNVEQWILLGGSYGTRLGLEYLNQYTHAEAAVLMGLFPPEIDLYANLLSNLHQSLKLLFRSCEQDSDCQKKYPELRSDFYALLAELRSQPIRLDYGGKEFVINTQDALLLVHQMLYNRQTITQVPAFIEALKRKENARIRPAIANTERTFNFINAAMYWSVNAYEEVDFNSESAIATDLEKNIELSPGPAFFASDPKVLTQWHKYRSDFAENQPKKIKTPILIINGAFDPITPTSNAEATLPNLPNAYLYEFPYDGHTVFNTCFYELVDHFLRNEYKQPAIDCRANLKPLVFE